ncbi:MAG TPA: ATP-binding protein, partial [Pirellulales bacterium]
MERLISSVKLAYEQDLVLARQQARHVARLLGFDQQDQVRIATAASEAAREGLNSGSSSQFEFAVAEAEPPTLRLRLIVIDSRRRDLPTSPGIVAARRVMDDFEVEADAADVKLVLAKELPPGVDWMSRLDRNVEELAKAGPRDVYQEFQSQNQELLQTLTDLRKNQNELAQVNRELEETNRGVVALYAELEEKADSLRRAAEEKSRFYSSMSHEFRTPITSILRLARMLLDRLDGDLTPHQEKQVGLIHKSAHNLLEWVNDLLDLAKADAGRLEVRTSAFRISDVLAGLRGMMRPLLNSSDVALVIDDVELGAIPELFTDEGKLTQVLRNLIANAIKFTERGEVRVAARIPAESPDLLELMVADTGVGIAPEDQGRVFEEFVQIDNAVQSRSKGTGLGLALCRRFVELLGGDIRVQSEVGRGSTFTVVIPQRLVSALPPAASAALYERVLVIDDGAATRQALMQAISGLATQALEADCGTRGLELVRSQQPSLVFLDLNLP